MGTESSSYSINGIGVTFEIDYAFDPHSQTEFCKSLTFVVNNFRDTDDTDEPPPELDVFEVPSIFATAGNIIPALKTATHEYDGVNNVFHVTLNRAELGSDPEDGLRVINPENAIRDLHTWLRECTARDARASGTIFDANEFEGDGSWNNYAIPNLPDFPDNSGSGSPNFGDVTASEFHANASPLRSATESAALARIFKPVLDRCTPALADTEDLSLMLADEVFNHMERRRGRNQGDELINASISMAAFSILGNDVTGGNLSTLLEQLKAALDPAMRARMLTAVNGESPER